MPNDSKAASGVSWRCGTPSKLWVCAAPAAEYSSTAMSEPSTADATGAGAELRTAE